MKNSIRGCMVLFVCCLLLFTACGGNANIEIEKITLSYVCDTPVNRIIEVDAQGLLRYAEESLVDGSIRAEAQKQLTPEEMAALVQVLTETDFMSLPEKLETVDVCDGCGMAITLRTPDAEHTSSAYEPRAGTTRGHRRYVAVSDMLISLAEDVRP